jgi:dihydrofolate reductase
MAMQAMLEPAMARLELVVAIARNGVIGKGNGLPWHLRDDLMHFKRTTMGYPMLMGRRTWDSIGRPLPGRESLVLTRDTDFVAPGATVVRSVSEARALGAASGALMVVGGAQVYALCLAAAAVIHLTDVHAEPDGDVRFPAWSRAAWRETWREEHRADADNDYDLTLLRLERG